jgi:hypothetical protein
MLLKFLRNTCVHAAVKSWPHRQFSLCQRTTPANNDWIQKDVEQLQMTDD